MLKNKNFMYILIGMTVVASVQMHMQASLGDWKMQFLGEAEKLMMRQVVHKQENLYEQSQVRISKLHALEIEELQMEAFKQVVMVTQRIDEVVQESDEQLWYLGKGLKKKGEESFQDLIGAEKQKITKIFKEVRLGDVPTYNIGQIPTTTPGALRINVENEVEQVKILYEEVLDKYNHCDEEVMKDYYKKKLVALQKLYTAGGKIKKRMEKINEIK